MDGRGLPATVPTHVDVAADGTPCSGSMAAVAPVWPSSSLPVYPPPCTPGWPPTVALAPSDWLPPYSIEEKATTTVEAELVASELAASLPLSVSASGMETQAQQIDFAATPSKLEERAETKVIAAATASTLVAPSSPSAPTHHCLGWHLRC